MMAGHESLYLAKSLPAALDALAERGSDGAPLAGGTWIMRAPIRHETHKPAYVALSSLSDLKTIAISNRSVEIGAGASHSSIATALADMPEFAVLAHAAGHSANPAVRSVATVGGNLCASAFAAADLVPALLCLDAKVEIAARGGAERMSVERFLAARHSLEPGRLLTKIVIPRIPARTAHARLPLRKAGDYPVAIVSLAIVLDDAGKVATARIAVGSVETVARRWERLEAGLCGDILDPQEASLAALRLSDDFTGRDGIEAPGWYRVSVLPALVRRAAMAALAGS